MIKVRVLNVRWVVFDKSNVSSLKGGFYWGFCVLGVGRCGNGVKMGGFREGGEFEIRYIFVGKIIELVIERLID